MIRYFAPAVALLVGTTVLSGCSYDRSFMQMDSNSGVPFFGFQWAVDSGSRPSESASDDDKNQMRPSLIDLRAPSKRHHPGRDHRALDAERNDTQTVSMNRRSLVPVWMSEGSNAHRASNQPLISGDIPIRAIMPRSGSSSAAKLFHDRREAF